MRKKAHFLFPVHLIVCLNCNEGNIWHTREKKKNATQFFKWHWINAKIDEALAHWEVR